MSSGSFEQAFRRPAFLGGRPVVLADGNPWYVPLPILAWGPQLLESVDGAVETLTTFGPGFDRLVWDVRAAETAEAEAGALLALAVDLIGRNYDLAMDHYRALLRYVVAEPDGNEILWSIYAIASGSAPRTFARWCRLGVLLAGADPDRVSVADAYEIAAIQVHLGRHVPADRWVEELVADRRAASVKGPC